MIALNFSVKGNGNTQGPLLEKQREQKNDFHGNVIIVSDEICVSCALNNFVNPSFHQLDVDSVPGHFSGFTGV